MHLIYFDEAKDDPDTQKHYWVSGIAVDAIHVKEIESKIAAISEEHFGTPCISRETEFHAADIFHRKHHFKQWNDQSKRVALIGELLQVLADKRIKKLYIKISREYFKSKFSAKKIDEWAFMLLCERANSLMGEVKEIGMLIGDRESSSLASRYADSLSNWRNSGTDYSLGRKISHLIDTVHFTESHSSRMLQLADIHTWCRQFYCHNRESSNSNHKLMLDQINLNPAALTPRKYKEYPHGC